ncbi:MAG: hypothetical protein RL538_889, partial [Candidatus Parcubacteria bacterium]
PDPDRLARDPYLQLFVIEEIEKAGKKVLFCTIASPDRNDEDQLMMFELRGMLSKYEKVRINSRFRSGKLRKAKKHVMLSEAPYGYILVKRFEDPITKIRTETHIIINEVEAKVIKLIFTWYVHNKLSMRQIALKLKEIGAVPRNNVNGDWNTSTIGNILKNPTYIGDAYYRRTQAILPKKPIRKLQMKRRRDKKTSRTMRPTEQWMKVTVPAILDSDDDKKLFYQAQEQREKNSQMCSRNRKNDYLMGGKIYCTCGAARTGEGPQGGKYLYYRCGARHNNQSTANRKCELQAVNARIADDAVWNSVIQMVTTQSFLRKQLELFYKKKSGGDSVQEKIEELETKIDDINNRIVELKQFVLDDKLPVAQYSELRNEADTKLHKLRTELVETKRKSERTSQNLVTPEEFELVLEESVTEIYGLKFEQKRAIVVQLIDEVVAEPGHLTVTGYIGLSSTGEVQELEGTNYSSNSSENHVKFKSSSGNRWSAQRRKINTLYRPHT